MRRAGEPEEVAPATCSLPPSPLICRGRCCIPTAERSSTDNQPATIAIETPSEWSYCLSARPSAENRKPARLGRTKTSAALAAGTLYRAAAFETRLGDLRGEAEALEGVPSPTTAALRVIVAGAEVKRSRSARSQISSSRPTGRPNASQSCWARWEISSGVAWLRTDSMEGEDKDSFIAGIIAASTNWRHQGFSQTALWRVTQ
jgi:hypothetical protein